jgi:hypothetical protein
MIGFEFKNLKPFEIADLTAPTASYAVPHSRSRRRRDGTTSSLYLPCEMRSLFHRGGNLDNRSNYV